MIRNITYFLIIITCIASHAQNYPLNEVVDVMIVGARSQDLIGWDVVGVKNTDDNAPILLKVVAENTTTLSNGRITLNFWGSPQSMDIYLPALEFGDSPSEQEYVFWVAEDGSTYWARTNSDGTHHGGAVNQSALYAMWYDDADL